MIPFGVMENITASPSQIRAIDVLYERVIIEHGADGLEYKRFEVHHFSTSRMLEVFIEVGKTNETGMDAIMNRSIRQIFIGERGGCELTNPKDPKKHGKIKGLDECIIEPTL
jgi:hypothetical protein